MAQTVVRAGAVVASVLAGLAAPLALARQQADSAAVQQRPVFRGGANFVYVDAYPRRDGRIVPGLTAADFQILEDGKPQAIDLLQFIEVPPYAADETRKDPNTVGEAERLAGDPRQRVFVIYLDSLHLRSENRREAARAMRQPLRDFLERSIGPSDLFGVITDNAPVSQMTLGRRLDVTEAAIADYWRVVVDERPSDQPRPRTPREQVSVGAPLASRVGPAAATSRATTGPGPVEGMSQIVRLSSSA